MIYNFSLSHFGQTAESNRKRNREQLKADANIFSLETYFISKYIERHLRQSKLLKETNVKTNKKDKFLRLDIGMDFEKNDLKLFPESRSLSYHSTFNYKEVKHLRKNNRTKKFLEPVLNSLPKLENHIKNITPVVQEIVNNFNKDDFQNIWVYARKKVKGVGTAKIICELTPLSFVLKLVIEDKNEIVLFSKTILETMPDSLFYHHRFKSLIISDDNKIVITQRLKNDPLYSISVSDALDIGVDSTIYIEQKNIPKWWIKFGACMLEPNGEFCPQNS